MDSHARLHAELISFLRQHCPVSDERHLVLLGWMVTGLVLSQTVCFDQWNHSIPLKRCLAASWQRRCRRWLSNGRINVDAVYGSLVLWAIQHWQQPGQALTDGHISSETVMRSPSAHCSAAVAVVPPA